MGWEESTVDRRAPLEGVGRIPIEFQVAGSIQTGPEDEGKAGDDVEHTPFSVDENGPVNTHCFISPAR